jgi:hypothetical protein
MAVLQCFTCLGPPVLASGLAQGVGHANGADLDFTIASAGGGTPTVTTNMGGQAVTAVAPSGIPVTLKLTAPGNLNRARYRPAGRSVAARCR